LLFEQVAHRAKIAVGGHSYGAFMTANLLVHASDLFCCGIARSGAYNRTLTPFGFQVSNPQSSQIGNTCNVMVVTLINFLKKNLWTKWLSSL
jgi:dipeptidyl aminopeptidase/acylaminoacyl peptidase